MNSSPRKGAIALCSRGALGLIESNRAVEVMYEDCTTGVAWVGIHLTDKLAPVGTEWSSRTPRVVGHVEDFDEGAS